MASPADPDSSIFTGQPCAPPCWYGIVAGETGYDALLKLLHQNPDVVQSTIKHDASPESWGDVSWRYPTSADHGGIAFLRDEIVQVLELDSESQFTMGDAVRRFGQPTKIQIWSGLFGQEQSGYGVLTFYPEVGLGFRFQMRLLLHNNRASVQPELVVDEIYYFGRGSIDDIISTARKFEGPTILRDIYELPMQDWHGFGDYEIL